MLHHWLRRSMVLHHRLMDNHRAVYHGPMYNRTRHTAAVDVVYKAHMVTAAEANTHDCGQYHHLQKILIHGKK